MILTAAWENVSAPWEVELIGIRVAVDADRLLFNHAVLSGKNVSPGDDSGFPENLVQVAV